MFFLFDLTLDKIPCLPEVQALNDMDVLHLVGGKIGEHQINIKLLQPIPPTVDDQELFPIGDRPKWQAVIAAIANQPLKLMKSWTWNVRFSSLEPALGKLFTNFTHQMWLLVNSDWLIDPNNIPTPVTLEEAMGCWTIQHVYGIIAVCAFEACNAGLPGHLPHGRPQTSFSSRVSIFFPLKQDIYHPRSSWNVFRSHPGYLHQFHELMDGHSEEEQLNVMDRLREIFSHLHCLPCAVPISKGVIGKPWVISKQGCVQFVTNPLFHKILRLSNGYQTTSRQPGS